MALIIHSVILYFVFVRNVLHLFIYFLAIFLQGCISPALKRNQSLKKRSAPSVSSNKKVLELILSVVAKNATFAKIILYVSMTTHPVSPTENIIHGVPSIVIAKVSSSDNL